MQSLRRLGHSAWRLPPARPHWQVHGVSTPFRCVCQTLAAFIVDRFVSAVRVACGREIFSLLREWLTVLYQGVRRGTRLPGQLLTLATGQPVSGSPKAPIRIQSVFRRALEDSMSLAEAKYVDIGVQGIQNSQIYQRAFTILSYSGSPD